MPNVETVKTVVDVGAVAATVSAFMFWIPPITALLTLIWTCIRLYETETCQKLLKWNKDKFNTYKIKIIKED